MESKLSDRDHQVILQCMRLILNEPVFEDEEFDIRIGMRRELFTRATERWKDVAEEHFDPVGAICLVATVSVAIRRPAAPPPGRSAAFPRSPFPSAKTVPNSKIR